MEKVLTPSPFSEKVISHNDPLTFPFIERRKIGRLRFYFVATGDTDTQVDPNPKTMHSGYDLCQTFAAWKKSLQNSVKNHLIVGEIQTQSKDGDRKEGRKKNIIHHNQPETQK